MHLHYSLNFYCLYDINKTIGMRSIAEKVCIDQGFAFLYYLLYSNHRAQINWIFLFCLLLYLFVSKQKEWNSLISNHYCISWYFGHSHQWNSQNSFQEMFFLCFICIFNWCYRGVDHWFILIVFSVYLFKKANKLTFS